MNAHTETSAAINEVGARELVLAFVALVALTGIQLLATHNVPLITHPMWLDECVSFLLVNDRSFTHMSSAIHGGVDTNGPAFYLSTWPLARLLGGVSIAEMRFITAAFMLLGVTGTYALCRCYVERERAVVGALLMLAHPAVLVQMWQARMYGLWVAIAAWFCFSIARICGPRAGWRTTACACVCAAILVTAHWFGIIAVALVMAPALILNRRVARVRSALSSVLAWVCVVLLVATPLIQAQRHILTIATWVHPVTLATVREALRQMYVTPPMIVIAIYLAARVVARTPVARPQSVRNALAPLALVLFPFSIVLFSLVLQPALVERYLLPTTIGLALVAALAAFPPAGLISRWALGAAATLLIGVASLELNGLSAVNAESDARIGRADSMVTERAAHPGRRVVFARRFEAYPVLQAHPELAKSIWLLDFDGNDPALMARTIFERDLGRAVHRFYPRYQLIGRDELSRWGEFLVVTNEGERAELERLLPAFTLRAVSTDVFVATARTTSAR